MNLHQGAGYFDTLYGSALLSLLFSVTVEKLVGVLPY